MSSNRDQLDSLSGSWSVSSQSLQEEIKAQWECEASSGVFNYVFGLIHRELSLQTPKLPEHRSIFSLMHTVPQSIWPIADFLVFAHLSHFNVSDHNKTKGLIPKHLTSWQDNRWAFWTVCVIRRTSYQQSHMLALVRLVRGCFAALQYLRIRWNREFCSQAESPEGQTMIQNTLPSPARDNEGPKSDWDA